MNTKRHSVFFFCLVLTATVTASRLSAQSTGDVKYSLKPAATIKSLLTDSIGKRVVLRLESSEEMEGTVTMVGEHLVHLSKLSKRDFFDAFVSIDRVSAVIVRVR